MRFPFFHIRLFTNNILILPAAFVLSVLLYLGGRTFVVDQFVIPTWSMAPTLVPGDRVVVNKLIMGARLYTNFDFRDGGQELKSIRMRGWRSLRHNDIVVFNFPQVGGRIAFKINHVYCKRCVALPGDTLSIEDGHYLSSHILRLPDRRQLSQPVRNNRTDRVLRLLRGTHPFYAFGLVHQVPGVMDNDGYNDGETYKQKAIGCGYPYNIKHVK